MKELTCFRPSGWNRQPVSSKWAQCARRKFPSEINFRPERIELTRISARTELQNVSDYFSQFIFANLWWSVYL
jgi:hypothetical protein